jgi:hypothetical protein
VRFSESRTNCHANLTSCRAGGGQIRVKSATGFPLRSIRVGSQSQRFLHYCQIDPELAFDEVRHQEGDDSPRSQHPKKFTLSRIRLLEDLHRIISVKVRTKLVSIKVQHSFPGSDVRSLPGDRIGID